MPSLKSSLHPPNGFHPSLITVITLPSQRQRCSTYLHYVLPPHIFVDPHELALRHASYAFNHWGSRELEKPVHALDFGDAELLVGVKDTQYASGSEVKVEVPMHLRYGRPSSTAKYEEVELKWPTAFLLCANNSSDHPPPTPCTELGLPEHIQAALPPQRSCIVIPPTSSGSNATYTNSIFLPIGSTAHLASVELGTAAIILACFFWVAKVSWDTAARLNSKSRGAQRKEE